MFSTLQLLFGCAHTKTTFPLTPKGRGTYVACCSCGKEFSYDFINMRRGEAIKPDHSDHSTGKGGPVRA